MHHDMREQHHEVVSLANYVLNDRVVKLNLLVHEVSLLNLSRGGGLAVTGCEWHAGEAELRGYAGPSGA